MFFSSFFQGLITGLIPRKKLVQVGSSSTDPPCGQRLNPLVLPPPPPIASSSAAVLQPTCTTGAEGVPLRACPGVFSHLDRDTESPHADNDGEEDVGGRPPPGTPDRPRPVAHTDTYAATADPHTPPSPHTRAQSHEYNHEHEDEDAHTHHPNPPQGPSNTDTQPPQPSLRTQALLLRDALLAGVTPKHEMRDTGTRVPGRTTGTGKGKAHPGRPAAWQPAPIAGLELARNKSSLVRTTPLLSRIPLSCVPAVPCAVCPLLLWASVCRVCRVSRPTTKARSNHV